MSAYRFDVLVFIGRLQPLHNGHLTVTRQGLAQAERLIVLLGSANQPRSALNPWTAPEREAMLRACLSGEENKRLLAAPLPDFPDSDEDWVHAVEQSVAELTADLSGTPEHPLRIGLIGHAKDQSSYYLALFPQWDSLAVENVGSLHATTLRQTMFAKSSDAVRQWLIEEGAQLMPAAVCAWLLVRGLPGI